MLLLIYCYCYSCYVIAIILLALFHTATASKLQYAMIILHIWTAPVWGCLHYFHRFPKTGGEKYMNSVVSFLSDKGAICPLPVPANSPIFCLFWPRASNWKWLFISPALSLERRREIPTGLQRQRRRYLKGWLGNNVSLEGLFSSISPIREWPYFDPLPGIHENMPVM